jgi:hypothetical protein
MHELRPRSPASKGNMSVPSAVVTIKNALAALRESKARLLAELDKIDRAIMALRPLVGDDGADEPDTQTPALSNGTGDDVSGNARTDARVPDFANIEAGAASILESEGSPLPVRVIYDELVKRGVDFGTVADQKKVLADLLWRRAHDSAGFVRLRKGIYGLAPVSMFDGTMFTEDTPVDATGEDARITDRIISVVEARHGLTSGGIASALGYELVTHRRERKVVQTIIGQWVANGRLIRDAEGGIRMPPVP